MARLTARQRAQKKALSGQWEEALAEYEALEEGGDTAANAALAELAAYQGRWKDVTRYASAILREPQSIQTLNVYDDMVQLVALAGLKQRKWAPMKKLAEAALAELDEDDRESGHGGAVEGLIEFAAAKGKASTGWPTHGWDTRSEDERIAKYDAAMNKLAKKKKKFKNAEAKLDYCVAVADTCGYHEAAVELYDETEALPNLFDLVLFIATGLVLADREDEAWDVIVSRLDRWWPYEDTQLVPVALLSNETLRSLMTEERLEEVLATARGPEAG